MKTMNWCWHVGIAVLFLGLTAFGRQPHKMNPNGLNSGVNPNDVAILRAWPANLVTTFTAQQKGAGGVAFDGQNIWVANSLSNTVTEYQANNGKMLCSAQTGKYPLGVAYDGANIWVANFNGNSVTKIRASTCKLVATYTDPGFMLNPFLLAFDGTHIWVTNLASSVAEALNKDGTVFARCCGAGNLAGPAGVAVDGSGNVWVANTNLIGGSATVTEINAAGAWAGNFPIAGGTQPVDLAYDGANMWVTDRGANNVYKMNSAGLVVGGPFAVGTKPTGIVFDGANMWVANLVSNNVSEITPVGVVTTYPLGNGSCGTQNSSPTLIAFDGANIWVSVQSCAGNGVEKM
jgi:DNA-binding beta-propeller fold protein YncE